MSATRKIILHSAVDSDKLLIRTATITERLGQPFTIDLELLSPDERIDFDALLGKEARIEIALDEGDPRTFHAFVVGFQQTGRFGTYVTYQARCVPWLWFLTRTANCRIFQNISVPDIVKQVFRDLGYTDFKDQLTKNYRVRDYCVQYRETDFNFLQRLMEEEGIYYYFVHTQGNHTLVLVDSYSGHEKVAGYETIEYYPPSSNEYRETDHIWEWRQARNVPTGKYVVTDYDFTKPRARLETQYVQQRPFPKSSYEWFDYPGGYAVVADGDHYARARLESLQADYERFNAAGNARGQAVGCLFALDGHPRPDQNKEYLVVAATYRLHAGEYESGRTTKGERDFTCHFEAIDSREPYRAPITTRKPSVGGPQTAIVVGPEGEEIFTDKYGRVKVKFHWDRAAARNETSSCWVRVSQIWAGKNWGWMSIPRIGQEVVVDFLEGDPDQPLITGRVYNQDNMPPYDLPANKTQSGMKTRSSSGGSPANFNEIRFEDKKGAEQLYIHAEKNQDSMVENDETHTVGHDRTKTIGNNETVSVGVNRTEAVGANENISIGANRTESVGVNESISVGALQAINVGAAQMVNVGAAQMIDVGAGRMINVGVNLSTNVAKDESRSIGGNRTSQIDKNDSLQVGKNLVIDAGDSVTIKTGSASISMKKDGTIVIKGKDIKIEGSGKIDVKASSDITLKGSKVSQN